MSAGCKGRRGREAENILLQTGLAGHRGSCGIEQGKRVLQRALVHRRGERDQDQDTLIDLHGAGVGECQSYGRRRQQLRHDAGGNRSVAVRLRHVSDDRHRKAGCPLRYGVAESSEDLRRAVCSRTRGERCRRAVDIDLRSGGRRVGPRHGNGAGRQEAVVGGRGDADRRSVGRERDLDRRGGVAIEDVVAGDSDRLRAGDERHVVNDEAAGGVGVGARLEAHRQKCLCHSDRGGVEVGVGAADVDRR